MRLEYKRLSANMKYFPHTHQHLRVNCAGIGTLPCDVVNFCGEVLLSQGGVEDMINVDW